MSARVLIVDSDRLHGEALSIALRQRGYFVRLVSHQQVSARDTADILQYDVVMIDLTIDQEAHWRSLDRISAFIATTHARPGILCYSKTYRGPGMKLRAERKGARFVYARPL